ncbi:MAG: hypothetical protein LBT23_12195 [Synergistaceae bacterium]|nr:hypothetical protein [Synergistaceae bacterium]
MDEFSVSILQIASSGSVTERVERARRLAASAEDASDVILLPELWTGESSGHDTALALDAISEICSDMGCFAVTGGMPWEEDGTRVLRTWIVDDRGCRHSFTDKAHLSSKSGEGGIYSRGETHAIFNIGETTAAAVSAYDLMFPEYCRQLSLAGARIFFVSASWPLQFGYAWDFVLQGAAFTNQVYVAACNGAASPGHFCGNSALVSPWGNIIERLGEDENALTRSFRLSEIKKCKKCMPVEHDRRIDIYRLLS